MSRSSVIAFVAIAFGLVVPAASGATVNLSAMKDASIFQNNVNNSSGAANGLIAGTNGNASPRRALLAFDVAGTIPAGAVIQNVQLSLVLGSVAGGGGPGGGPASVNIGLHKLLANWDQGVAQQQIPASDNLGGQGQGIAAANGDVTWNSNFHGTSLWATPGADFDALASAIASVGTTVNATDSWTSTAPLVSNVQDWLDNPTANFGWALVNADETTANTGRTFYSSDTLTASFHPQLAVTYAPVPEPTAASLALAGAVACWVAVGRADWCRA